MDLKRRFYRLRQRYFHSGAPRSVYRVQEQPFYIEEELYEKLRTYYKRYGPCFVIDDAGYYCRYTKTRTVAENRHRSWQEDYDRPGQAYLVEDVIYAVVDRDFMTLAPLRFDWDREIKKPGHRSRLSPLAGPRRLVA
jgi:hypothetical protein